MLLFLFFRKRKQLSWLFTQSPALSVWSLGFVTPLPLLSIYPPPCQSLHGQSQNRFRLLMYPSLLMSSEIRFAHIMKTAHGPSVPCHYSCQCLPFRMDLGLWSPLVAWPVSLWKLNSWNCCSQGLRNLTLASLHSGAHISLFFTLANPDPGYFLLPWILLPFSHLLILKAWLPSPFLVPSKTSVSSGKYFLTMNSTLGMPTGAESWSGNCCTSTVVFFGSVPGCIQRNNCDSQPIWKEMVSFHTIQLNVICAEETCPFRRETVRARGLPLLTSA